MLLDLLTRHHIIQAHAHFMQFFPELIIHVIGSIAISPAHSLQIVRLLREISCKVLLHSLYERFKLLLLFREIFLVFSYSCCQLTHISVHAVVKLTHLLVS